MLEMTCHGGRNKEHTPGGKAGRRATEGTGSTSQAQWPGDPPACKGEQEERGLTGGAPVVSTDELQQQVEGFLR